MAVDADGAVVSCCTLLPHRLRYGGVGGPRCPDRVRGDRSQPAGGLVRAQFDLHHQWAAEQGALVLIITGIPVPLPPLGYGYAFEFSDHTGSSTYPAPEGWTVEPADTAADGPPSTTSSGRPRPART